nr:hypothetical protein [uncultured Marinifilum sp.]
MSNLLKIYPVFLSFLFMRILFNKYFGNGKKIIIFDEDNIPVD